VKLFIYSYTQWAFGTIHNGLAEALRKKGWAVTIKDWCQLYPVSEFVAEANRHDRVMTICDGAITLVQTYGIPREKIIVVAHAEVDIQTLGAFDRSFHCYAGYGVVSDSLACSSLALGVTRTPTVVRLGLDVKKFKRPIAKELKTVGYAARMERKTPSGVEQKRGALAKACVEEAGLVFKATENTSMEAMPGFYGSVDALLMPSLQEGAGLPPIEAAAAGRLVVGTPVGHWPRLAYEGLGILAPLNEAAFKAFTVEKLRYYKANPAAYRRMCALIQKAAAGRDWSVVVCDWIKFLEGSR
jgi:Glycosyl transferases group 1